MRDIYRSNDDNKNNKDKQIQSNDDDNKERTGMGITTGG
jgi:hypothetical protein